MKKTIKKYDFTAKNVRAAVDQGLKELNLKQEDVDIKVISEGGVFSKAKIQIITSEEEIKENHEKSEKVKENDKKETKEIKKTVKKTIKNEIKSHKDNKNIDSDKQLEDRKSIKFIEKVVTIYNENNKVKYRKNEDTIFIEIYGEKSKNIIGYRGSGIKSLQTIARAIERKEKDSYKINIDINQYKDQRKKELEVLAENIAKKVEKTKKSHKFEPMNSYERLIIHSKLSSFNFIETESVGSEPNRYLVVKYKN